MNIHPKQKLDLFNTLKLRFEKNLNRHKEIDWNNIIDRLENQPEKLLALYQMEETGGEPDVVGFDKKENVFLFYDCSPESPNGRRSLCYDQEALESRKENKPQNNALTVAKSMGIDILNETEYRFLQTFGKFDSKTSSWIKTPSEIRKLGGALFADYRYETIFIYHNGASSYYAARGFRGCLKV